jgi:hypothetical protein
MAFELSPQSQVIGRLSVAIMSQRTDLTRSSIQ